MKIAAAIAGGLLGLMFIAFSLMVLLNLVSAPPPPEGSPVALFMTVFATTGYLTFVKVCELVGGIMVAIPKTRNLGLLVLGPIIVNILAFHLLVAKDGIGNPILLAIMGLTAFLLWCERKAFWGLVQR